MEFDHEHGSIVSVTDISALRAIISPTASSSTVQIVEAIIKSAQELNEDKIKLAAKDKNITLATSKAKRLVGLLGTLSIDEINEANYDTMDQITGRIFSILDSLTNAGCTPTIDQSAGSSCINVQPSTSIDLKANELGIGVAAGDECK